LQLQPLSHIQYVADGVLYLFYVAHSRFPRGGRFHQDRFVN